jgi:hypothetical protein
MIAQGGNHRIDGREIEAGHEIVAPLGTGGGLAIR